MSKANTLRKEISDVESQLVLLKAKLDAAKGDEFYRCGECNKRTVVSTTSIVYEHRYIEPYSCNGGAYWTFRRYIVLCNKCCEPTHINKDHEMYNFVIDHLSQFFEQLDWHPMQHCDSITLDDLRQIQK